MNISAEFAHKPGRTTDKAGGIRKRRPRGHENCDD